MSSSTNKTTTDFFLDVALFIAFTLAMTPHVTGIPLHEWLSLAFALAIVIHLALHWNWIVGVATGLFSRLWHESRLNFLIDLVFFFALITLMVSGLAISKIVLPTFGILPRFSPVWRQTHRLSAEIALATLGLHCGMHAKWIAYNGKRYFSAALCHVFRKRPVGAALGGEQR